MSQPQAQANQGGQLVPERGHESHWVIYDWLIARFPLLGRLPLLSVFMRRTDVSTIPLRVQRLLAERDANSERMIGWVQLVIASFQLALYALTLKPTDEIMGWAPVPIVLSAYALLSGARLYLSYQRPLPASLVVGSIIADTALLMALLWWVHLQYGQPPAFVLKLPAFIYVFVFVALRALRFDPRYVLLAGITASLGWVIMTALVVFQSPVGTVTHNFVDYLTGNRVLIGAEVEKIFTLLLVTFVLTVAVREARYTLVRAVREEAAGRDIRRFLSSGLGDVIANSETETQAGQAVERNAAVMMLDIRGFTRLSSLMPPSEIVALLTQFHARLVPIVEAHGGVIDKFLGDGVMATFGAVTPSSTPARDALMALESIMADALIWRQSLDLPGGVGMSLEVNGAVVAGPLVFATLGSATRLEYTVIGETVNLAAKLEKHNKVEHTRALAPYATLKAAREQGFVSTRNFERRRARRVMGVEQAMELAVIAAATQTRAPERAQDVPRRAR